MGNICFCGKEKREDRLACPRCFEFYRKDTRGRTSFLGWVKTEAQQRLKRLGASEEDPRTYLERELQTKKEELGNLEGAVAEETSARVKERLAEAGQLRQEELKALRNDIKDDLWRTKGGNRLYAERKTLESEIETNVAPIRNILEQIEKKEKEQSLVSQVVTTVLPNDQ